MADMHRDEISEVYSSASSQGEWEEQDEEQDETLVEIISLFDDKTFPNAQDMLIYTKTNFGFDMINHIKSHGTYPARTL